MRQYPVLLSQLKQLFDEYKVKPVDRELILEDLEKLKTRDILTAEHSLRTTFIAIQIAKYMGLNPKSFIFTGTGHDLGKLEFPSRLFKLKTKPTEADWVAIKAHPVASRDILVQRGHYFSSEVVLRHHRDQKDSYPKELPSSKIPFSDKTKGLIDRFAVVLEIADCYDSALTRVNSASGGKRRSMAEVKAVMLAKLPKQSNLVKRLFSRKVLGGQGVKRRQVRSITPAKVLSRKSFGTRRR